MPIHGSYDPYLVALSFVVACFASYTALDLGTRLRASEGHARLSWLLTAAIAMGGGIWSMHFVAMLAFLMPMPVSYDVRLTVISLLLAIGVTGFGFYGMSSRHPTTLRLMLSGTFMGVGIVSMHYTGMAAMRMPAALSYDKILVAVSILIAIAAAIAALWLAFRTAALWQRALAAIVMGIAISGMHYTGMAAAIFTSPDKSDHGFEAIGLAQTNLALAIAGITFVILILALVASVFDRQFAVLAERESMLLRDNEEMLRRIYRETPLPLHAVGRDGRIEKTSDAWLDLVGYARDEVVGRELTAFMTQDSRRRYNEIVGPTLMRDGEIREAEYQFRKKTGEILDVLLSARQELIDGKSVGTLGGLIDITARKRAETALRQSQRMEAIGQLTGGVAHDFNNLLMVVSGAAEQLKKHVPDTAPSRHFEMIATAVKRGQHLTRQLLSFARRRTLETTTIDLSDMLPNFGEMLKRSLRGDIDIRTSAEDGPCRTRVDSSELELALLNLGVNARDAMPEGGVLTVSVRRAQLSGQSEVDHLNGDFVAIEVKDTGVGIKPDIQARVFEPFFTTKGPKGTGLGLSQVYGFARQSGGTATIESNPGYGTKVTIYLPATNDPVASDKLDRPSVRQPPENQGAVLLVEDSSEVASISAGLLEQLGYDVEHVASGGEALRRLQKAHAFVFVFSDILMPGSIGGVELARIVRDYHSGLPVLLTTGFSERADEAKHEGFLILQKPFDVQALSAAIAELKATAAR
jgi:PAS domain S-box-containing protein